MRIGVLLIILVACGGVDTPPDASTEAPEPARGCAHVVDGEVAVDDNGTYTVSATVSSADTGDDKYADAWEVRTGDGTVLGVRELLHPHVDEQPFTRSLGEVTIPDGVASVTLAARDSVEGFCGQVLEVEVP